MRARQAERLAKEREAKGRAEQAAAAAAALVAAKLARRAEKTRTARAAFAIFKWRRHAAAEIHARREARIAASRTAASPIPGIGLSALRAAVSSAFSKANLSNALTALRARLDASRNVPWGFPVDVPSLVLDKNESAHLSHWKLVTCSGFDRVHNDPGRSGKSISNWLRAKLSRGQSVDSREQKNADGKILSLYASKPVDEKTLWICARDVSSAGDGGPSAARRRASAAVFVMDFGFANKTQLGSGKQIPRVEEQRLCAFVQSLESDGERPLPLLVLCACADSLKNWRGVEASVEAIVLSASTRGHRDMSDVHYAPAITVRVSRMSAMRDCDAATVAEWSKWNDALTSGLRWAASVAPPEPYFRSSYLRDEMADALSRLNVENATSATPGECVRVWNDCVEGLRLRLSSSKEGQKARVASGGLAVEFENAGTPGLFQKSHATRTENVFDSILDFAKLPAFPEPMESTTPVDRVTTYLGTLNHAEALGPGAVSVFFKKIGVGDDFFSETEPRRDARRPLWPAVFREIFAQRLVNIETAQKRCEAGCVYVSPLGVGGTAAPLVTPTKAPLSDLPAQTQTKASPVSKRKSSPEKSEKRKRISFDTSITVPMLDVPASPFPQLARAREDAENLEAWLLDAASPAPIRDGDDAAAKLRRLAGWEMKTFT